MKHCNYNFNKEVNKLTMTLSDKDALVYRESKTMYKWVTLSKVKKGSFSKM